MMSCSHKFNIYLTLACICLGAGCASHQSKFSKQEQSTIRLYLEGNPGDTVGTGTVMVTRQRFPYTVERAPFLTEADLRKVSMINEPGPNGGYGIELLFTEHGAFLLDMLTTAHRGRHIVVFSQFPPAGFKEPKPPQKSKKSDDDDNNRGMEDLQPTLPSPQEPETEVPGQPRQKAWLAAVQIHQRNSSGIFVFSPDASREETARIVRGLKNVIAYLKSISTKD
jgi:hypothetical protein